MSWNVRSHWRSRIALLALIGCLPLAAPLATASKAQTAPASLQAAFSAAANEFGVPESILLSVSYNQSRWEQHGGAPSTTGGYGVMHLVDIGTAPVFDAKGEDTPRVGQAAANDPSLHTLDTAAKLLSLSPEALKQDAAQNIRGGAVLLAQYARETVNNVPTNEADWYGAVAKYSGSDQATIALSFADDVYATIKQGVERTTTDGQRVRLRGKDVTPNARTADPLNLRTTATASAADCPSVLMCDYVPAAYTLNNPADPGDYGNYDPANREADGGDIQYIVIHDTETPYDATIRLFQNPLSYVSSHYVLRASDGAITQMVDNRDVAWTAGNWYINAHSINLEHEGYAIEGAAWYSERMYVASARLTRYLADKYNIPLDRAHIVGHDDVPGPTPANQPGMHWDPGPFWDWERYMLLLGAPLRPEDRPKTSAVVTIKPNFETNIQPLTYCYTASDCRDVPPQATNFVYLRTAPGFNAPYITNQYIGAEPTRANNWANKAVTGQQFAVAERKGDWTAIWFGGQKAWFYNPYNSNTTPGKGTLIKPKAGLESIPVYGRAYPEAAAYPAGVPVQSITPIYTMPKDQVYVAKDKVKGDYFRAPVYTTDRTDNFVVEGQTEYYLIFFNHRFAYVKASDVDVVSTP